MTKVFTHDFDITVRVRSLALADMAEADRHLCCEAIAATMRSYAPYSHFHVGAAIRLDNGEVVSASNQENVAYPSGTCAERATCYYAHSRWPEARFEAIAIAARGTGGELVGHPIAPCGACRQALLEYEMLAGHDVRVMLIGSERVYELPSVRSLLPLAFTDF